MHLLTEKNTVNFECQYRMDGNTENLNILVRNLFFVEFYEGILYYNEDYILLFLPFLLYSLLSVLPEQLCIYFLLVSNLAKIGSNISMFLKLTLPMLLVVERKLPLKRSH